jgi:hypothetical protein
MQKNFRDYEMAVESSINDNGAEIIDTGSDVMFDKFLVITPDGSWNV